MWVKGRALVWVKGFALVLHVTMSRDEPVLRWALPVLTLAWAAFLFWVSTSTRGGEAAVGA